MNSQAGPLRWLMLVVLGCILGLTLALVTALILRAQMENMDVPVPVVRQVRHAPVRLSDDPSRNELIQVIQGQLAAFRKDDYPKAYYFAASSIKDQVPLPAFERMVRAGYPVIARSSSAEFGVILDNSDQALVNVGIVSESGKVIHYRYFLQHERSGWKITGVVRVPFEGTFI